MEPIRTFPELLRQVAMYDNPKALNYYHEGVWHSLSTEEFLRQVRSVALALKSYGLKPGDMVGIVASPSPFWTIVDCAIICSGMVSVPLFANISVENFEFEIKQTELKTVFMEGEEPWKMIKQHKSYFERIINMDPHSHIEGVVDWETVLQDGKAFGRQHPGLYESMLAAAKPDDLASIVYTSGSTGTPKGAELTQLNLVCMDHPEAFYFNKETDRYLCVLPLAHIFGRVLNYILIAWGVSIYYFNDLKNFANACREIKPSILVVVPRLLEKVYAKMVNTIDHGGFLKRKIGQWAFGLAHETEKNQSFFSQLFAPVADKLVFSALRNAMGGKVRIVITGGAAMNPDLQRFFMQIGVPIYEGWGMTEGCPGCVNRPGRNKIGAIGPPLPGVDIKISHEGEILMRGPIVMRGYYKNPEATKMFFDSEGWLKTGDKGVIDDEGFVHIVGRLKEMFKTSTGEYVVPGPIEQELVEAPFIDWAMVIADKRKFASCLLFPNMDMLKRLKKEHGSDEMSDIEFLDGPYIKEQMDALLNKINSHLNHWEQLRAYKFIPKILTIDGGEITPSLKLRRPVLMERYAKEIESMYPGEKIR